MTDKEVWVYQLMKTLKCDVGEARLEEIACAVAERLTDDVGQTTVTEFAISFGAARMQWYLDHN